MRAQGIAPAILTRLADAMDWGMPFRVETGPDGDPRQPLAILLGEVDADALSRALGTPSQACIECSREAIMAGSLFEPTLRKGGLYMGLSTATAYALEPARIFVEALSQRIAIGPDLRPDIELALHEAIVNAVVHGNLEIPSGGRDTMEAFLKFCSHVEERLKDPLLGMRRIEIAAVWAEAHLTLTVRDEGQGYVRPDSLPLDDPDRKSGRGLTLIQDLSSATKVLRGGRQLAMRFDR